MKKRLTFLLALGLALALAGCGGSGGDPAQTSSPAPVESPEQTSAPAPEPEIITPVDGFAEGNMGDVLRTYWYDFSVDSAYTCAQLEDYVPAEGNQMLVVQVTVTNQMNFSLPMMDTDFQAQWSDDADEAYSYPITNKDDRTVNNTGVEPLTDDMLPEYWDLAIDETRTGILAYEVPVGEVDFSISTVEYFEDGTTGDTFFVFFTPEAR